MKKKLVIKLFYLNKIALLKKNFEQTKLNVQHNETAVYLNSTKHNFLYFCLGNEFLSQTRKTSKFFTSTNCVRNTKYFNFFFTHNILNQQFGNNSSLLFFKFFHKKTFKKTNLLTGYNQQKNLYLNVKKNNSNHNVIIYDYVYKILLNFFEAYFKKNFYFFLKKSNYLLNRFKKNNLIVFIQRKLSKSLKFSKNKFFFKELVEILWLSFLLKDSTLFINWFVSKFQHISLRNHKNFLRILNLLLKRYYNFFFKNNNVLGFFFDIRGKWGVSGNAKKRHLSITSGLYSSSNKSLRLSCVQSGVKTSTGLLGVTFCIFF